MIWKQYVLVFKSFVLLWSLLALSSLGYLYIDQGSTSFLHADSVITLQFTIAENFGLLFAITVAFAFMGYVKLRHLTRPNLRLD